MTKEQRREFFQERCKEQSIKLTPQRLIVYDLLMETTAHPTVEMLYAKAREIFPTISLDTVHRTLMTFCDIGVASMVEGTGSPKRFEGNHDVHHHVRCIKCDRIIDFSCEEYDCIPVPPDIDRHFQVLKKTVHVEGICHACRRNTNP